MTIEAADNRMTNAARLMRNREFAVAADAFASAFEAGADPEVCLARRAECLYYVDDRMAVAETADQLERLVPNSPWPSYLRGLAAKKVGDTRTAREWFHRAAVLGHPQAASQLRVTNG